MSLVKEYFSKLDEYSKKYNNTICILMQVGSFYEIYGLSDADTIHHVTTLLNIQITKKNKNISEISINNPYLAGFPVSALGKYLPILLNNNYCVIVIEQIQTNKTIERRVAGVYSPSIRPIDSFSVNEDNMLVSILIEVNRDVTAPGVLHLDYAINIINFNTNTFVIHASTNKIPLFSNEYALSHIATMLNEYSTANEYIFLIKNNINIDLPGYLDETNVVNYLQIDKQYHWIIIEEYEKNYTDIHFQNLYLQELYAHTNFGLLTPIEYFQLEFNPIIAINIMYTIEFIKKYNPLYIKYIREPRYYLSTQNILHVDFTTLQQLSVFRTIKNGNRGRGFSLITSLHTNIFTIIAIGAGGGSWQL